VTQALKNDLQVKAKQHDQRREQDNLRRQNEHTRSRDADRNRRQKNARQETREDRQDHRQLVLNRNRQIAITQLNNTRSMLDNARRSLTDGLRRAVQNVLSKPAQSQAEADLKATAQKAAEAKKDTATVVPSTASSTNTPQMQALTKKESSKVEQGVKNNQAVSTKGELKTLLKQSGINQLTHGARSAHLNYRVGGRRGTRPSVKELRLKGLTHTKIKEQISAHVEMVSFIMLSIWSACYKKLHKLLKAKEREQGIKLDKLPKSYEELIRQIRFSRSEVGDMVHDTQEESEQKQEDSSKVEQAPVNPGEVVIA
jgi:hypothetical protein